MEKRKTERNVLRRPWCDYPAPLAIDATRADAEAIDWESATPAARAAEACKRGLDNKGVAELPTLEGTRYGQAAAAPKGKTGGAVLWRQGRDHPDGAASFDTSPNPKSIEWRTSAEAAGAAEVWRCGLIRCPDPIRSSIPRAAQAPRQMGARRGSLRSARRSTRSRRTSTASVTVSALSL